VSQGNWGQSYLLQQLNTVLSVTALTLLKDYRASLDTASHWASENITTSPATIIAPASNTVGLTIVAASFAYQGNNDVALFADTAAPSAYTDTSKNAIGRWGLNSGYAQLAYPIWVPSGKGLYAVASGAVTGRIWYKLGA